MRKGGVVPIGELETCSVGRDRDADRAEGLADLGEKIETADLLALVEFVGAAQAGEAKPKELFAGPFAEEQVPAIVGGQRVFVVGDRAGRRAAAFVAMARSVQGRRGLSSKG